MSDGMAFLTGAAFAGVAVLFLMKGGDSLGVSNVTPPSFPMSPGNQTNPYDPYNPYAATPSPQTTTSPQAMPFEVEQQRLDAERMRVMLEQQRTETEQLRAQVQNQQMLIEELRSQLNLNARPASLAPTPEATPTQPQEPENELMSGIIWGLGGMVVTVSGGIVAIGALAVLTRQQQRPPRTTYVVQQPYHSLPPSVQPRRRSEAMPPQLGERHIDYVEYDR